MQTIAWINVIISLGSIAARVVFSGSSSWALGRAMFTACAVYLVGSRVCGIAYEAFVYNHLDPMIVLAIGELAMIPLAMWWLGIRYVIALSLFIPGAINTVNASGESWSDMDLEYCLLLLVSLYASVYLSVLVAFSPAVTEFLRSPRRPPVPAGHCQKCGYSLRGLPTARCPECGTVNPVTEDEETEASRVPKGEGDRSGHRPDASR